MLEVKAEVKRAMFEIDFSFYMQGMFRTSSYRGLCLGWPENGLERKTYETATHRPSVR